MQEKGEKKQKGTVSAFTIWNSTGSYYTNMFPQTNVQAIGKSEEVPFEYLRQHKVNVSVLKKAF